MSNASPYVLDISVLLYTPEALYDFPDKEIVLPVGIIEELDILKLDLGEKGRSAQIVSKMLDECRQYGSLVEGIDLPNGGKLRIELTDPESGALPYSLNLKNISNRVLAVAWTLSQKNKDLVFVSQDENLRTKANTLSVPTVSYEGHRPNDSCLYSGMRRSEVSKEILRNLSKQPFIAPEEMFPEQKAIEKFYPGEGLLLSSPEVPDEGVLAVYNPRKKQFEFVPKEQGVWGIRPRNPEQRLALSLLLNPTISVVTLSGKSGTGKTLLALAVGLQQMMVDNIY